MSDIDLTAAIEAGARLLFVMQYRVSNEDYDKASYASLSDAAKREATNCISAALPYILAQIPEYIPPTAPKPGTRWEYGIMRDEGTPKPSRAAAEREIERQRKAPRSYRITNQRLVRRLVSDWEDVK